MIKAKYSAAITDKPWWLAGGIPRDACVAAYQPIGAASLAASYINLADPGTYTCSVNYTAPTLSSTNGWVFSGQGNLSTTIIWINSQKWSALMRFNGAANSSQYMFGYWSGSAAIFGINPYTSTSTSYYNGGTLTIATGGISEGVLGIAGNSAYRNGIRETGNIGSPSGTNTNPIIIAGGYFDNKRVINIQAFVVYNSTLTADQVVSLTNAMNAL